MMRRIINLSRIFSGGSERGSSRSEIIKKPTTLRELQEFFDNQPLKLKITDAAGVTREVSVTIKIVALPKPFALPPYRFFPHSLTPYEFNNYVHIKPLHTTFNIIWSTDQQMDTTQSNRNTPDSGHMHIDNVLPTGSFIFGKSEKAYEDFSQWDEERKSGGMGFLDSRTIVAKIQNLVQESLEKYIKANYAEFSPSQRRKKPLDYWNDK